MISVEGDLLVIVRVSVKSFHPTSLHRYYLGLQPDEISATFPKMFLLREGKLEKPLGGVGPTLVITRAFFLVVCFNQPPLFMFRSAFLCSDNWIFLVLINELSSAWIF